MKFKSVTMILDKLLLIGAISEFIIILFNLKASRKIENIFIIFFIIASMSDFIVLCNKNVFDFGNLPLSILIEKNY